jgi:16S rRNA (cytosine967-C5)-methyltransferase
MKLEKLLSGPPGRFVRNTFAVDWTAGVGDVPDDYDRVIVDAPCSGVGTLRRRPEIVSMRQIEDIARLSELQVAIVRRAATRVRDGGRLIFAVCSVLREEGEEVVAKLVEKASDAGVMIESVPFDSAIAKNLAREEHSLRLLPHIHGTDGYFIASLRVRKSR